MEKKNSNTVTLGNDEKFLRSRKFLERKKWRRIVIDWQIVKFLHVLELRLSKEVVLLVQWDSGGSAIFGKRRHKLRRINRRLYSLLRHLHGEFVETSRISCIEFSTRLARQCLWPITRYFLRDCLSNEMSGRRRWDEMNSSFDCAELRSSYFANVVSISNREFIGTCITQRCVGLGKVKLLTFYHFQSVFVDFFLLTDCNLIAGKIKSYNSLGTTLHNGLGSSGSFEWLREQSRTRENTSFRNGTTEKHVVSLHVCWQ